QYRSKSPAGMTRRNASARARGRWTTPVNFFGVERRGVRMSNMKMIADCSDWGCDIHGRDAAQRGVSRRGFMKGGALALIGTSTIPAFLSRSVLAEVTTAAANKKKLVVLFQRGAADGLNIVVPYKEKNY